MPTKLENDFQDPGLKQAVCRCWAGECASALLHQRVRSLLEESRQEAIDATATPHRINRFGWMIWPMALAAMLLICVGIFTHFHSAAVNTAIGLPEGLEKDLVFRHDHCCRETDHHTLDVSRSDDAGIAQSFRSRLNRPVVMFRPSGSNWTFRGASICPVGTEPAGHLVFAKGGGALSIFSLPKSSISSSLPDAKNDSEYCATVDHHCIVAIVKNGALFCMVSSGSDKTLGIDELKKMEAQIQPTVASIPIAPSDKVLLTELLQPVR